MEDAEADERRRVEEMALALATADKAELAEALRRSVAEDVLAAPPSGRPGRCPRCGCPEIAKGGHDSCGRQRWLCHGCGRTFCPGAGTLLSRSHLDADTWAAFAGCMADCCTLRDSAARCRVSLRTAWFMRIRLCEALCRRLPPFEAGEGVLVEADETSVPASASGNHSNGSWPLPRQPRPRGGLHGLGGQERAAVIACCNDRGDDLLDVTARGAGPATDGDVRLAMGHLALGGALAFTDWCSPCSGVLEGAGRHVKWLARGPRANHTPLNLVNALHGRLKGFLSRFRGVSTRRLLHYLMWFKWRDERRRAGAGRQVVVAALLSLVRDGEYLHSWKSLWEVQYPWGMLEHTNRKG